MMLNFAASPSKSSPLWNLTPWRSLNWKVRSSRRFHSVARTGLTVIEVAVDHHQRLVHVPELALGDGADVGLRVEPLLLKLEGAPGQDQLVRLVADGLAGRLPQRPASRVLPASRPERARPGWARRRPGRPASRPRPACSRLVWRLRRASRARPAWRVRRAGRRQPRGRARLHRPSDRETVDASWARIAGPSSRLPAGPREGTVGTRCRQGTPR